MPPTTITLLFHTPTHSSYQGDTTKLVEDLVALRPTTIPFVPRILNRIYDKITGAVEAAGGSKKSMFDRALKAKTENMRQMPYFTTYHKIFLIFCSLAS